jgi:hypothetical protein
VSGWPWPQSDDSRVSMRPLQFTAHNSCLRVPWVPVHSTLRGTPNNPVTQHGFPHDLDINTHVPTIDWSWGILKDP